MNQNLGKIWEKKPKLCNYIALEKQLWILIVFIWGCWDCLRSKKCQMVFKPGVQNLKDFCLRINIPKGNYWILRIGVVLSCQKLGIILVIKWLKKWCYQSYWSYSHCFFTIMNTQKKGNFQFCFPGLLGIHRNPK